MQKKTIKLLSGIIITAAVVLGIAIAAQLIDRENVLERVISWPDFEAETLGGDVLAGSSLLSNRPVLFIYFNTECSFCRAEIGDIAEYQPLHNAAALVFISDEERETIQQFRRELDLEEREEFLFLVDPGSEIKRHFGIRAVPATYLYNREGELAEFYRGAVKAETLFSRIIQMNE